MLYHCGYTWQPGTTREKVAERFLAMHDAGLHHSEEWRGWYALAGGGAGFLLVETDGPRELTAMLQPYMDLVSWDVRAVYELHYEEQVTALRQVVQQAR